MTANIKDVREALEECAKECEARVPLMTDSEYSHGWSDCAHMLAIEFRDRAASVLSQMETPAPHDDGHPHLIAGEFQSDKYPACPRGKVPLSVKDKTAQDLLWQYAQRRRAVDAEFADDLEIALTTAGYTPAPQSGGSPVGDETVRVPKRALDWLFGAGPEDNTSALNEKRPAFWWRSKFKAMLATSPQPLDGVTEEQIERAARAMCFGNPDEMIPSIRYVAGESDKLHMFFDGPLVPAWTMIVPQARAGLQAALHSASKEET